MMVLIWVEYNVESSPYHHAFKYTLDIPEDLVLSESVTPTEQSSMLTPTFGLDRLRSHTPRAESVDEQSVFVWLRHSAGAILCLLLIPIIQILDNECSFY